MQKGPEGFHPEFVPETEKPKIPQRAVAIKLHFFRHGEKAGDELTELGRQQAYEKGLQLTHRYGARIETTIARHSPTQRTQETAGNVLLGIDTKQPPEKFLTPGETREFYPHKTSQTDLLGFRFSPEAVKAYQANGLQWFLEHKDRRPDKDTESPYEHAGRIAKLILQYAQASQNFARIANSGKAAEAGKFIENEQRELSRLMASHSGHLENFIARAYGIENFDEVGGALKPTEGFDIGIVNDGTRPPYIHLQFCDQGIKELSITDLASYVRDANAIHEQYGEAPIADEKFLQRMEKLDHPKEV